LWQGGGADRCSERERSEQQRAAQEYAWGRSDSPLRVSTFSKCIHMTNPILFVYESNIGSMRDCHRSRKNSSVCLRERRMNSRFATPRLNGIHGRTPPGLDSLVPSTTRMGDAELQLIYEPF
jgi:hypothetical protein